MAIQTLFNQLDGIKTALDYINKQKADFTHAEKKEAVSLLDSISVGLEDARKKITAIQLDPSITTTDLSDLLKRVAQVRGDFFAAKSKILRAKPDLPPPERISPYVLKVNKYWRGMILNEMENVDMIAREGLILYDPSEEDPFEAFRNLGADYRSLRENFSMPFLVPGNEIRFKELIEKIETEMQQLIDRQVQTEPLGSSAKKTSDVMKKHFEELKSALSELQKVYLDKIPSLLDENVLEVTSEKPGHFFMGPYPAA